MKVSERATPSIYPSSHFPISNSTPPSATIAAIGLPRTKVGGRSVETHRQTDSDIEREKEKERERQTILPNLAVSDTSCLENHAANRTE